LKDFEKFQTKIPSIFLIFANRAFSIQDFAPTLTLRIFFKMKIKTYYIHCALLALLTACKTAAPAAPKVVTPTVDNSNTPANTASNHKVYQNLLAEVAKPQQFQSIKIGSKINVEMDKFVPSLNAQFYIENQQKIWVNVTALFMNFGRALCTPQGFKAYEKLNSTYIDADYQFANDLLGVNFINYQVLQNLLLGRNFMPINPNDYELNSTEQGYWLTSKKPQIIENKGQKTAMNIKLLFAQDFKLSQVQMQEQNSNHGLNISYQNWTHEQQDWFPKNITISVKKDKNKVINIENNSFEFIKMDTPYAVPNGYTKRDL
jgi:Domain of unknown function (DUF4292)